MSLRHRRIYRSIDWSTTLLGGVVGLLWSVWHLTLWQVVLAILWIALPSAILLGHLRDRWGRP